MSTTTKFSESLIVQIIPAIKLPRNVPQFFSYVVPKKLELEGEIKVGSLVKIPFRNNIILGMVYKIQKENLVRIKYKLKNVDSIIDYSISLSEKQIRLAEYVSKYYYAPLSMIIKIIIPPLVKKGARKKIELNSKFQIPDITKIEKDKLLGKIRKKNKILLVHNLGRERHSLYLHIAKKEMEKNEQALILLPEYFDVYNLAGYYQKELNKKKIAILTSELTKNQYFDQWQIIKKGSAKIIIGTRQAIFAPFKNLGLIIADDEHNSSYKQWDQNPRYHAINTAKKLAEIWKAKIILSSPAPSVENYFEAEKEIFSKINFFQDKNESGPAHSSETKTFKFFGNKDKLEIIDMNNERKMGNCSIMSEQLKDGLMKKIYNRKQAIIFISRLGENTITKCKDCEYTAQCDSCGNVLISRSGYLYCARCKEKSELIKECPRCKGQRIISFGYGSEKLEKEIKKLFENKNIKISRLDSGAISTENKQLGIYKNFIDKKTDVLIGTQMVVKNWGLENLGLFAILSPEIIFSQPDFRTKEKSFQLLKSVSNSAGNDLEIIVQTNKDNSIYKSAANKNIDGFYKKELKDRKETGKIGYPPFSRLIKIIYKDRDAKKCENEAKRTYGIMEKKISSDKNFKNKFEITHPFPALSYKEHGKYRWHIVIKSLCDNIETRDSLLNLAKKGWVVDIDPESVF